MSKFTHGVTLACTQCIQNTCGVKFEFEKQANITTCRFMDAKVDR